MKLWTLAAEWFVFSPQIQLFQGPYLQTDLGQLGPKIIKTVFYFWAEIPFSDVWLVKIKFSIRLTCYINEIWSLYLIKSVISLRTLNSHTGHVS